MKYRLLKIVVLFACMAVVLSAGARGFSYVYIQGDKATPFYVKFEDQMMPRYGKNYNIIPQLVPGPINVQILFQQNAYPPQRFTIMVPESGFRGFLLLQKAGSFSLYDIHQQFYLLPGNRAEDDRVVPYNTADAYVATNAGANTNSYNNTPSTTNTGISSTIKTKPRNKQVNSGPKFLPNVELSNERYQQPAAQQQQQQQESTYEEIIQQAPPEQEYEEPVQEATPVQNEEPEPTQGIYQNTYTEPAIANQPPTNNRVVVVNSDCSSAINDNEFEDLYNKTQSKSEKSKLKFLLTKMDACYTTNQARILAESLGNDPEKYTFLKRVYSRVTDQHNFPMLENMLTTQEWKSYFKLILPK